MNRDDPSVREQRGPIAYMAGNGVAANVLMLFLLVAGLVAAGGLVQEVLPTISLDRIEVVVPYPGATPEEVEESIVRKIEEQIRAVDGLKRVEATASEGFGSVIAEFRTGTDITRALDDVKAEVSRIPTFPAGAERPEVRELTSRQSVIRLLIYGDVSERALKELAYDIEEGISSLPEVSLAQISGVREYEISIDVPQKSLRSLGLTLEDVAFAVRQGSLGRSAGKVSTTDEEILVRTLGKNYDQGDFEEIVVLTRFDGSSVRVGDIATVQDGFADTDLIVRYNGQRAVRVDVYRTSEEQVLEIAEVVKDYLAAEVQPTIPEGVSVEIWKDNSEEVGGRLGLMIENALLGLALVFIALALFLEIWLAAWVVVGLAVAFMGTFLVMGFLDISINMFSLMALVLVLGIVVDDAIVVGESVFSERERGRRGLEAAIRGTRRVSAPVIFSVLTTIAAFSALLSASGPQGKLSLDIPMVVITVLILSLLESLLILPSHLAHLPAPGGKAYGPLGRLLGKARESLDALLKYTIRGPLDRGLRLATDQPFIVLASAAGLIILSVGVIESGIVPNQFITPIEGTVASADLEMPVGTPSGSTVRIAEEIEAAGHRAVARIAEDGIEGDESLEVGVAVTVGEAAEVYNPVGGVGVQSVRGHIASVQFKLHDWERHNISAAAFVQAWREEVGILPEIRSLSFSSNLLALDLPVHFEFSHPDPERLATIKDEIIAELTAINGVVDVHTSHDEGIRELQLELKPRGRTLNLTLDHFASQVRSAFFGAEALRVQRGREDVRVYVRLPEEERNSAADVEGYLVRTPGGGEVPLGQIATAQFARYSAAIHRLDGRRAITVTSEVDAKITTGQQVSNGIERSVLTRLAAEDPDFYYAFGGQKRRQEEANAALGKSFLLALLVMYALMAISFGSYSQPLVIMSAVPLGAIGALAGHMLLGLNWGLWSTYGLIGVSGVVVNDSLMMIRFINDLKKSGLSSRDAIITGAKSRFRAILLTSATTFLGVAPLVFETSTHAQHLVPMATSLGFGILGATFLLMLVVPALVTVQYNFLGRRERRLASHA